MFLSTPVTYCVKRGLRFSLLLSLLLFVTVLPRAGAQVSVTTNQTALQLVQKLVGNGITFLNPTLACANDANGIFSVTSSNLGIDSGIVLTSGTASAISNPGGFFASGSNDPNGDPQLDSLLPPGQVSRDACVLEFDFVPDGDSLLFNYVFGSEEYPEFACSGFNDIFAFLISGPGFAGPTNLALVPGTNIPVTINSINMAPAGTGYPLSGCQTMGPGAPFNQYYVDNASGTTIVYDGLTKVLTARTRVNPCETYHIKLAIGDASDQSYDSGVFLEQNSFRSNQIKLSLGSDLGGMYPYLVEGCIDGSIFARRTKAVHFDETILLSYTGTATRNTDYFNVPDSITIPANDTVASFLITSVQDNIPEGTESIVINTLNRCNGQVTDSIVVPLREILPVTMLSPDTAVCAGTRLPLHVEGDDNFTYTWTSKPAANNLEDTTLALTWDRPDTTTTYFVKAVYQGCPSDSAAVTVRVEPNPQVKLPPDLTVCMRDSLQLLADVKPAYFTDYSYAWSPAAGLSNPNVLRPRFFSNAFFDYHLKLEVTTPLGCAGSDSIVIQTRPPMDLYDVTPDARIRYGEELSLSASGADYYFWHPTSFLDNPNIASPVAAPKEPTRYMVIGMNQYGCRDTGYVFVDIDFRMDNFIPNAFSPNGDGRNDLFRVFDMRYRRMLEFRVLNRWGQEVFYTTDPLQGWDGTFQGKPQDIGTYYYILRVAHPDGSVQTFKGDVSLLR